MAAGTFIIILMGVIILGIVGLALWSLGGFESEPYFGDDSPLVDQMIREDEHCYHEEKAVKP